MTASNEFGTDSRSVVVDVMPGVATKLDTRAMVCDAVHGTILVTTDESEPSMPNRLVFVNATTGVIERWVEVGKRPMTLALSDDATTAWVGISGEGGFRKVDTATLALGPKEAKPTAMHYFPGLPVENGTIYASSIVVLPGSTTSIAIASNRVSNSGAMPQGVAVYDDGEPRAVRLEPGSFRPTFLTRSATENELYGIGRFSTGRNLLVLSIAAEGVREKEKIPVEEAGSADTIELADGRLYLSNGPVLTAAGGRFGTVGLGVAARDVAAVSPHLPSQTVFAAGYDQIGAFDVASLRQRAFYRPSRGDFIGVVRCGPSVVARLRELLVFIPASHFDAR